VGRAAIAIGAVLIAAGGAALGFALTRKPAGRVSPEASAAMAAAKGQLDSDLRAARVSVEQRARTLAESSHVRATIGTNAETVTDMLGKELAFQPEPEESLELVQVDRRPGAPGAPVAPITLVALPAGSGRGEAVVGTRAVLTGERLTVAATAPVTASIAGADAQFAGFVTARRAVDLRGALAALRAAGVTGSFELHGQAVAIAPLAAGAATEVRPLASEPGARLVVAAAPAARGLPIPLVAVGAGVAALGLVLLAIGIFAAGRRGEGLAPGATASSAAPVGGLPTVESRPPAGSTQITGGVGAAGTPSPIDPRGATAFNPNAIGPGALIGRWEVIRRLGSGGMADVYLAQSRGEAGFEKLVAIKVMHSHLARNQRAVDHFLDEARLAARIHHPNVVGIQDLGRIGNDYVIVMDYVEGVDLERLLTAARAAERQVPLDVALGILVRICDGLHAAHTAVSPDGVPLGIIHRDVKSANVLVSRQGGVKVVDFGIAKAAKQEHLTVQGETKGTPSMMAPEQRVGELVDVRADVYSVAAVGFEVLTGHAVNLDLAALAHLGLENWPHLPLPSSLRPALPVELDEILLGAMAFDRERRPADCAVLAAHLEAVIKRYGLAASDKDLARWVTGELQQLVPAFQGASMVISRPVE
jgi:hypothetical protein